MSEEIETCPEMEVVMKQKNITPKQIEILILIYRFRFLNRIQIQTLLNHKDYKRINAWLKDLTDKHYLKRNYKRTLLNKNKPAIYYLGTKSISLLKSFDVVNPKLLSRIYREHLRSKKFIDHCMTIGNLYLWFKNRVKDNQLHFFAKTDLSLHDYLIQPIPDAYLSVES